MAYRKLAQPPKVGYVLWFGGRRELSGRSRHSSTDPIEWRPDNCGLLILSAGGPITWRPTGLVAAPEFRKPARAEAGHSRAGRSTAAISWLNGNRKSRAVCRHWLPS